MTRRPKWPAVDYELPAENEKAPTAMPSWSWTGLALLCAVGLFVYYLIYRLARAIVIYVMHNPLP